MSILNVSESLVFDNSIVKIERHSHLPYSNSFNNNDEIRIPVQQTDIYTLPWASHIYVEGRVLKAADATVSRTAKFVNNFFCHLFEEIRFEIGGRIVDSIKNPGIAATMKGYVSYNENEIKKHKNAGWSMDNEFTCDIIDPETGSFNVCVPLRTILGFAEDFQKILINVKHELVLLRSYTDQNAVINPTEGENVSVTIDKMAWKLPHITVSDVERLDLLKIIESGAELDVGFRSWELTEYPTLQSAKQHTWTIKSAIQVERPRWIILAFSTDRKGKLAKNYSLFDHCKIFNVKLYLNSEMYPYDNLNIDVSRGKTASLYEMYSEFQEGYYEKENEPLFSPKEFIANAPLIVIDCSRQNEILNSGVIDVRLEFETKENVPANTSAYCLIIHDKLIKYSPLIGSVRKV